jgi:histidine triad (HIT) family protein
MTETHPADPNCVFCKIIAKSIPSTARYESEHVYAFNDIHPKAPTHLLICPKAHYPTFSETPPEVLAKMNEETQKIAKQLGFDQRGYRLVINNGRESGQEVFHLHYHFLAGKTMGGF